MIPVPFASKVPFAGVAEDIVGAVASNTFASHGVPFGHATSKLVPAVCAEYQFEAEVPSPGVSLRSMETMPEFDPAGNGFALARSYTDQREFLRTRFAVCVGDIDSAPT